MSEKPEALRLADALDECKYVDVYRCKHAAAELRRLHAEVEALRADRDALQNTKHHEAPRGFVLNPDYLVPELRAQRDALLEALKAVEPILTRMYGQQAADLPPMQIVRAAIDAARSKT